MHLIRYYVAGRLLLEEPDEGTAPRVRDEVAFEGKHFTAVRVVHHKQMCPPDVIHVHLQIAEGEGIWPIGHP